MEEFRRILRELQPETWEECIGKVAEREQLAGLDYTELSDEERAQLDNPASGSRLAELSAALDAAVRRQLLNNRTETGKALLPYFRRLVEHRMISKTVLCSYSALGIFIAEHGEPERAIEHFEEALELFSEHPDYKWAQQAKIGTVINRCSAMWRAGRRDEAELEMNTLLASLDEPDHSTLALVLKQLAFFKLMSGNIQAAENYLEPVLERSQKTLPPLSRANVKLLRVIIALLRDRPMRARKLLRELRSGLPVEYLEEELETLELLARWRLGEVGADQVRKEDLDLKHLHRLRPLRSWLERELDESEK